MSETQPLIGNVSAQMIFGTSEDYDAKVEAARVEQEAMCGYPLKLVGTRHVEMIDARGSKVYEVFATFAPVENS